MVWPKNDGEKWPRKNIFGIATCGSHFLKIHFSTVDSGNSKLGFVTNFVY